MSDVHLEFCRDHHDLPEVGSGDILILAGDIAVANHAENSKHKKEFEIIKLFFSECSKNYHKVYYVFGNHEHYGSDMADLDNYAFTNYLKDNFNNIYILNSSCAEISEDWVILGATFWTNFNSENPLAMLAAQRSVNDYRYIKFNGVYLQPQHLLRQHLSALDWMSDTLGEYSRKNAIVVTHHAPSLRSIPKKYLNSNINSAYVSDYEKFIRNNPNIKYWVHGHTHDKFNYSVYQCKVICNPRGYVHYENTSGYSPHSICI